MGLLLVQHSKWAAPLD